MLAVTEGYLIGTLCWINEIKEYKRQMSRYYRELKKWCESKGQDFIRSQEIPKGCQRLVSEILNEDFCFSK